MPTTIGNVTKRRYNQLVREGRDLVEQQSRCQWKLGEAALEIEPLRTHGGTSGEGSELLTVSEALHLFAEDIGVNYSSLKHWRWVAARWPEEYRVAGVSHTIHRILASISDPDERFARIQDPPLDERTGAHRWTPDLANREVGRKVDTPTSPQERIEAIHDLARDETVAAAVATDFLRRPEVAFRAMGDDTARHLVNQAQIDRSRQAGEIVRQRAPMVEQLEHSMDFVDLVGACSQFVASIGRIVPAMRGRRFSKTERQTVHTNVARVRAAADWCETAVDTGDVTIDQGLARLLRDE